MATTIPACFVVTYTFRGSRFWASPLYVRAGRQCFATRDEAQAWADASHPELPEFTVTGIHHQGAIVDNSPVRGIHPSSWEARRLHDHDTDMTILRRR